MLSYCISEQTVADMKASIDLSASVVTPEAAEDERQVGLFE